MVAGNIKSENIFADDCRENDMARKENRKKLRAYLKNYRAWLAQAKEIETALARGEVLDSLRELLTSAKDDFICKCRNVQIIIGLTKDGVERRIMTMLYIDGLTMTDIARKLKYSYGHCANIELNAVSCLSNNVTVMQLLS